MDNTQLELAQKITQEIKELLDAKMYWENSNGFYNGWIKLSTRKSTSQSFGDISVKDKHCNFDVLKTLTLKSIDDRLEALRAEFAAI
jgi:hypothetical protein